MKVAPLSCIIIISIAVPEITLTSSPPPSSNGYFCPGPVQFTCVGTDVPILSWIFNGTHSVQYSLLTGVNPPDFPLTVSLNPPLPGVVVMITSASRGSSGQDITSTFSASASVLSGSLLLCEASNIIRNASIQEREGELVIINYYCFCNRFLYSSPRFSLFHLLHPLFPSAPPWRSSGLPPVVPLLHLSTCCGEVSCGSHP